MPKKEPFKFEISLSVLNHLGRNLYRNFITVIGEAISNSWDADANNVWIYIDRDNNTFFIKDDGEGMTKKDFQGKFLKVGYSKREEFGMSSKSGRPYIGAKGIGKLALLSCAEKISIMSKTEKTSYVGGVINNTGLDKAIKKQLTTDEYSLDEINPKLFKDYVDGHNKGTLIAFENIKDSIRNTIPYLKTLMALYFRFSLLDKKFNIFINDKKVTLDDLKNLSESTEFLWNINGLKDVYLSDHLSKLKESEILNVSGITAKGFIASVVKPRFLKITGTEEKAGIDLFVNGRLRERNILRHLPDFSTRHVASYIYGQIHFNDLDKDVLDKVFTSSREGVVEDNIEYKELLDIIKKDVLEKISNRWDEWRDKHDEDGDDENPRRTKKERRASSLYTLSAKEYTEEGGRQINSWVKQLKPDAEFNIPAYVDCFLSENLVRKYMEEKNIQPDSKQTEIDRWRNKEIREKRIAGISIDIRNLNDDLFYLDMENLVDLAEPPSDGFPDNLLVDQKKFTPLRNAVMHTSRLTDSAKLMLTSVFNNIKARINKLLSDD